MANKKRKETLGYRIKQFVEYNIAGIAFFWSGYVSLLALEYVGAPLWVSSSVSYTIGLTVNFLLDRYWVFRDNREGSAITTAGSRYIAISLVNLILNYVVLKSLTLAGVPIEIAPFISSIIFTPWNWLWYKFWVFKGRDMPHTVRKHHVKARPPKAKRPNAKNKKRAKRR